VSSGYDAETKASNEIAEAPRTFDVPSISVTTVPDTDGSQPYLNVDLITMFPLPSSRGRHTQLQPVSRNTTSLASLWQNGKSKIGNIKSLVTKNPENLSQVKNIPKKKVRVPKKTVLYYTKVESPCINDIHILLQTMVQIF